VIDTMLGDADGFYFTIDDGSGKLVRGYSDGTFMPNSNEFVAITGVAAVKDDAGIKVRLIWVTAMDVLQAGP